MLIIDVRKSRNHGRERYHSVSRSSVFCDVLNKAGLCGAAEVYLRHEPTVFCSSLVKSETTWLSPEELKLETNKYFCCVSIHRRSTRSLQMDIFAHFLRFQPTYIFAWDSFNRPSLAEGLQSLGYGGRKTVLVVKLPLPPVLNPFLAKDFLLSVQFVCKNLCVRVRLYVEPV